LTARLHGEDHARGTSTASGTPALDGDTNDLVGRGWGMHTLRRAVLVALVIDGV
jgi:hypothetical protein